MSWIQDYVKPGMVAVDVGANQGSVTSELLQAGASVVAIEPHWEAAQQLRETYPAVCVLEAAATDHEGTAIYHYSRQSLHGSLYKANVLEDLDRVETVAAVTLDAVCPEADAIKVDAQGAEAAILRGAQGILARRVAIWYVELWKAGLEAAGDSVRAVRELFEAHGYVPAGHTWDQIEQEALRHEGHSATDALVIPQE